MSLSTNDLQEQEYTPMAQPGLGNLIKESRKAKKLSQKRLGEQIGVSYQTIANWEKGLGVPIEANLIRLATSLDKPYDFFFVCTPKKEVTLSSFCENLRAYRKRYGITQVQLSEGTGISLVTIKAYENKNSGLFVSETNLEKLSSFFETSAKELLGISVTAETLHETTRDNYLREIKESIDKLNIVGLEKAAERLSEMVELRRYKK